MKNLIEQFSRERLEQLSSGKYAGTGLGARQKEILVLAQIALAVMDGASPTIPDGWKLVPVEPVWPMIAAAIKHHEGEAFLPVSLYKAMLAAAPAPGGVDA